MTLGRGDPAQGLAQHRVDHGQGHEVGQQVGAALRIGTLGPAALQRVQAQLAYVQVLATGAVAVVHQVLGGELAQHVVVDCRQAAHQGRIQGQLGGEDHLDLLEQVTLRRGELEAVVEEGFRSLAGVLGQRRRLRVRALGRRAGNQVQQAIEGLGDLLEPGIGLAQGLLRLLPSTPELDGDVRARAVGELADLAEDLGHPVVHRLVLGQAQHRADQVDHLVLQSAQDLRQGALSQVQMHLGLGQDVGQELVQSAGRVSVLHQLVHDPLDVAHSEPGMVAWVVGLQGQEGLGQLLQLGNGRLLS